MIGILISASVVARADGSDPPCPLVFTQEPPGAWEGRLGGLPLQPWRPDGCRVAVLEPGKDLRILAQGFASACDPAVSPDGKKVLFAGKESAGSYISQNDFRLHFGLGKRTKIDEVTVRWPRGAIQTLKDVPINKFLELKEPEETK